MTTRSIAGSERYVLDGCYDRDAGQIFRDLLAAAGDHFGQAQSWNRADQRCVEHRSRQTVTY